MKTSANDRGYLLGGKEKAQHAPNSSRNLDFQHKAWINDHDKKESGFWHL